MSESPQSGAVPEPAATANSGAVGVIGLDPVSYTHLTLPTKA